MMFICQGVWGMIPGKDHCNKVQLTKQSQIQFNILTIKILKIFNSAFWGIFKLQLLKSVTMNKREIL